LVSSIRINPLAVIVSVAAGAELVPVRYPALDRVDVLIAAVFLSTLVSRGGLQGI
jgi:hypothetical protein